MDWNYYLCTKPATVVGVVVKQVSRTIKKDFYVNEVFVKGWNSLDGVVEFIPMCKEHDTLEKNGFILRCNLTEEIKVEFENYENTRQIEL